MFELERELLKKIDIAYCAGLVDGEGCFFIAHQAKSWSSQIQLIVAMSDEAPLLTLKKTFGGNVRPLEKANKVHYRWVLCADNALRAAKKLLPFLQGKKEQARLFIAFWEYYKVDRVKHRTLLDAIEIEIKARKKVRNLYTYTFHELTPVAETECEDPSLQGKGSDSPNCIDDKGAEVAEMSTRLLN